MLTHQQLIERYALEPHPEGGWYKQTYKSSEQISAASLPERFGGSRAFSTAIYFLLEQGNFSAFIASKAMSAGISMPVIHCWYMCCCQTVH